MVLTVLWHALVKVQYLMLMAYRRWNMMDGIRMPEMVRYNLQQYKTVSLCSQPMTTIKNQ